MGQGLLYIVPMGSPRAKALTQWGLASVRDGVCVSMVLWQYCDMCQWCSVPSRECGRNRSSPDAGGQSAMLHTRLAWQGGSIPQRYVFRGPLLSFFRILSVSDQYNCCSVTYT